jgi:hypothetical protein
MSFWVPETFVLVRILKLIVSGDNCNFEALKINDGRFGLQEHVLDLCVSVYICFCAVPGRVCLEELV